MLRDAQSLGQRHLHAVCAHIQPFEAVRAVRGRHRLRSHLAVSVEQRDICALNARLALRTHPAVAVRIVKHDARNRRVERRRALGALDALLRDHAGDHVAAGLPVQRAGLLVFPARVGICIRAQALRVHLDLRVGFADERRLNPGALRAQAGRRRLLAGLQVDIQHAHGGHDALHIRQGDLRFRAQVARAHVVQPPAALAQAVDQPRTDWPPVRARCCGQLHALDVQRIRAIDEQARSVDGHGVLALHEAREFKVRPAVRILERRGHLAAERGLHRAGATHLHVRDAVARGQIRGDLQLHARLLHARVEHIALRRGQLHEQVAADGQRGVVRIRAVRAGKRQHGLLLRLELRAHAMQRIERKLAAGERLAGGCVAERHLEEATVRRARDRRAQLLARVERDGVIRLIRHKAGRGAVFDLAQVIGRALQAGRQRQRRLRARLQLGCRRVGVNHRLILRVRIREIYPRRVERVYAVCRTQRHAEHLQIAVERDARLAHAQRRVFEHRHGRLRQPARQHRHRQVVRAPVSRGRKRLAQHIGAGLDVQRAVQPAAGGRKLDLLRIRVRDAVAVRIGQQRISRLRGLLIRPFALQIHFQAARSLADAHLGLAAHAVLHRERQRAVVCVFNLTVRAQHEPVRARRQAQADGALRVGGIGHGRLRRIGRKVVGIERIAARRERIERQARARHGLRDLLARLAQMHEQHLHGQAAQLAVRHLRLHGRAGANAHGQVRAAGVAAGRAHARDGVLARIQQFGDRPSVFIDGQLHAVAGGIRQRIDRARQPRARLALRADHHARARRGQRERILLRRQRERDAHRRILRQQVLPLLGHQEIVALRQRHRQARALVRLHRQRLARRTVQHGIACAVQHVQAHARQLRARLLPVGLHLRAHERKRMRIDRQQLQADAGHLRVADGHLRPGQRHLRAVHSRLVRGQEARLHLGDLQRIDARGHDVRDVQPVFDVKRTVGLFSRAQRHGRAGPLRGLQLDRHATAGRIHRQGYGRLLLVGHDGLERLRAHRAPLGRVQDARAVGALCQGYDSHAVRVRLQLHRALGAGQLQHQTGQRRLMRLPVLARLAQRARQDQASLLRVHERHARARGLADLHGLRRLLDGHRAGGRLDLFDRIRALGQPAERQRARRVRLGLHRPAVRPAQAHPRARERRAGGIRDRHADFARHGVDNLDGHARLDGQVLLLHGQIARWRGLLVQVKLLARWQRKAHSLLAAAHAHGLLRIQRVGPRTHLPVGIRNIDAKLRASQRRHLHRLIRILRQRQATHQQLCRCSGLLAARADILIAAQRHLFARGGGQRREQQGSREQTCHQPTNFHAYTSMARVPAPENAAFTSVCAKRQIFMILIVSQSAALVKERTLWYRLGKSSVRGMSKEA